MATSAARPHGTTSIPCVLRLIGNVVGADWGSAPLLADLLGRAPQAPAGGGQPAEVWFGAHARNPSSVMLGEEVRPVTNVQDLEAPSFLVKLIAVAAPLSVQVHPDDATAVAGHAEEEAAVARGEVRERRFSDASGKPELLRAITPMRVLCGLRPAAASLDVLAGFAPRGFEEPLALLAKGDASLGAAVALLLRAPEQQVHDWLDVLATGAAAALASTALSAQAGVTDVARAARLLLDLLEHHPGDAGVLVALLLDDRDLAPGEALFVAPGVPHAYLSGLGVEVMASSDNVLRGGMTTKPVDVEAFLSVLDDSVGGAVRVGALSRSVADGAGWQRYLTPSDAFVIDEADVDGTLEVERAGAGPAVVLCLSGSVSVQAADGGQVDLAPGDAALVRGGSDPVAVRGDGTVVHVRAGVPLVPGEPTEVPAG